MADAGSRARGKANTVVFTLPISCQICLGKVKQPLLCPNNHVFCSGCIEIWLERNQQCPTCRVPISSSNPCKQILGGLNNYEDNKNRISSSALRKARFDLLYKEYETEMQTLQLQVKKLLKEKQTLEEKSSADLVIPCPTKEASTRADNGMWDKQFSTLTNSLQEQQNQYIKLQENFENLKQDLSKMIEENDLLTRENTRLKIEIANRSPFRYGRLTVAALESKLNASEKETSLLKKALTRNDKYIEELEKKLEHYTAYGNKEKEITSESGHPECCTESHCSISNPARRQIFGRGDQLVKRISPDSFSLPEGTDVQKRPRRGKEKLNEVVDSENLHRKVSCNVEPVSTSSFELEMPSPVLSNEEITGTQADAIIQFTKHKSIKNKNVATVLSDNSLDDTQKIQSELDELNISLTPEFTDCMKLLNRAERNVQGKSGEVIQHHVGCNVGVSSKQNVIDNDHGREYPKSILQPMEKLPITSACQDFHVVPSTMGSLAHILTTNAAGPMSSNYAVLDVLPIYSSASARSQSAVAIAKPPSGQLKHQGDAAKPSIQPLAHVDTCSQSSSQITTLQSGSSSSLTPLVPTMQVPSVPYESSSLVSTIPQFQNSLATSLPLARSLQAMGSLATAGQNTPNPSVQNYSSSQLGQNLYSVEKQSKILPAGFCQMRPSCSAISTTLHSNSNSTWKSQTGKKDSNLELVTSSDFSMDSSDLSRSTHKDSNEMDLSAMTRELLGTDSDDFDFSLTPTSSKIT